MNRRRSVLVALLLLVPWVAPRANGWRIDDTRSYAQFGVRLLWLHTISGRFEHVAGNVTPLPDGRLVIDAHIAVDSLAMSSPRLRRWALASDFFDAAHYPTMRFVSAPITQAALEHGGTLSGELTLHGATRPARFELAPASCAKLAAACRIDASGRLQRSAFGIIGHRKVLSDTVTLGLSITLDHTPG